MVMVVVLVVVMGVAFGVGVARWCCRLPSCFLAIQTGAGPAQAPS